jgi:hypothetical protein
MPLTIGPKLQALFAEPLLATVCTLNPSGRPEMTPIWYDYFDGFIWFNGTATRQWLQRMQASQRATFFLLDGNNAWRWAQIWGRVVEASDDADAAQFKRLGQRYGRNIGEARDRRYLKIDITSVKGHAGTPRDQWDVSR